MLLTWKNITSFIHQRSTFYRIHLFCFTVIPLISSGIYYACNGRYRISYLDSLFLCYSAMTVTGLSTVNLSTTTAWQQCILYLLMIMGDFTVVSWIMVLVRKYWFRRKCEYIEPESQRWMSGRPFASKSANTDGEMAYTDPSSQAKNSADKTDNTMFAITGPTPMGSLHKHEPEAPQGIAEHLNVDREAHLLDVNTLSSSPRGDNASLPPHTPVASGTPYENELVTSVPTTSVARRRHGALRDASLNPRATILVNPSHKSTSRIPGDSSFHELEPVTSITAVAQRIFPKPSRYIERKFTVTSMKTLNAQTASNADDPNTARWLKFDGLSVGRNSLFHTDSLSDEQLEEIGGVEYRALRLLSYLVPMYFVGTQLVSYVLIAPWLSSTPKYDNIFEAQPRLVQKPWFSLFQVTSGYTGGGLSLVDLGMVPFQQAYLMIFALIFVILAGNHALPIFLRLLIWILSKLVPQDSRIHESLSFLLHHPRRCFVYLFPMHQTWFLLACLVIFSALEWASFLILDIGLDVTESLPLGTRVVAGLFQGLAVRASGFSIVPIASLAPAVQFLYVVMMYIAVYPVAMSIRSTNVYEEKSLGVFQAPPDDEDEEPQLSGTRRERLGKYLGWHIRRQLSIDIWWLVWAVFIICIVERHNLLDEDMKWFDVFRVLFELVSAFGGIGLSLGLPSDNFAFSGALKPLSKLVVIIIMVRGRHRGLPVAVDRSIRLPRELVTQQAGQGDRANGAAANGAASELAQKYEV